MESLALPCAQTQKTRRPLGFDITGRAAMLAIAVTLPALPPAQARSICPSLPSPVRDLDIPRYYTDRSGTRIDPALRARRRAAEAPLRAFLTTIQRSADLALRLHDPHAARCALAGLVRWAQAGAWLGEMRQKQAAYQRNWDLAGAALAYLKVRRFAPAHERGVIEPWLLRWAHANAAFFARKGVKRNNHVYWMGLGALATGLATQQPALIARAREVMHEAAGAIRDDGALPLELARGSRALHYHAFALTPLTLMAELAARGLGEDWYALERGALHRLTALTASALERPSTFAALTGTRPHRATKPGYGWLYLYRARHPGRLAGVALDIPTHHRWLGGDVRLWRLWRPAR